MPDLGLQAVADAPGRVAQPGVGPRLNRLVAQLLRQREDPVVVDVGLVKVPLVVVRRPQVAVGPRLFNLELANMNIKS